MPPTILFLMTLFLFSVSVVHAQDLPLPSELVLRPIPSRVIVENDVTLEFFFENIAQGQVGLVRVYGDDVTGVRASFLDYEFDFFPVPEDGYYGFNVVGMTQNVGTYDLTLYIQSLDETTTTMLIPIGVILGAYIRQDITMSDEMAFMIDPDVEQHELAQLESIFQSPTREQFWDEAGFQRPLDTELTSPFGAFRIFNQTTESRHTGWDMRAQIGMPVAAVARGRVAFAGVLDLRGNYVLIDHGYGIYSGYAHLSVVDVTRGQDLSAGQIIGKVGSTGRSGGAHFHWEMAVNGEWVDAVDLTSMWMPLFNPSAANIENPPSS
jgi:hypothetical protein